MVRLEGIEPTHLSKILAPKASASANSAINAIGAEYRILTHLNRLQVDRFYH